MAAPSPALALWKGILAARAGNRAGTVAAVIAGILLIGGLAAVLWALPAA